jgi:predicted ATP-grasp superfamily ATP-dependent carboligase
VISGPRIVVTDAEERSVLATCRGLAAAGYRVSTVAETRFALGHWSRFSKERITFAGPHADPEDYVERLGRVLRRDTYDMVVPGAEASLLPISDRRALIEPYSRLGLPSHEVVLRALDKPLLQRHAAAVGLAPPPSIACSSDEEALAAARQLGFPIVVKPARSVTWTAGRLRQRGARLAGDSGDLEAALAAIGAPLTIQRYVPGTTIVSFAAVRFDGKLAGLTVARYSRTYPAAVGSAAVAVTIAAPPRLTEQVEELLRLIGWTGIFELELLELGENRFGAIDLNPRPFGWLALAVGAGANLPALWCDHVLGRRSVSPGRARPGVWYRWGEGDLRAAVGHLRGGHARAAVPMLRPHRSVVHAQFRIDDPAPIVARMLSLAQKASRRNIARAARAPRPGSRRARNA